MNFYTEDAASFLSWLIVNMFMAYLEDTLEPCHELTIYGMQSYMHILAVIVCEALDKAETFKDNKPYHQIFNYLSLTT